MNILMLRRYLKNVKFVLQVDRIVESVARKDDDFAMEKFETLRESIDFIDPDNAKYIDFFLIGMFLFNKDIKRVRAYYLKFCLGASHNDYYNIDEIKFLQRYALNLLWLSRGRQLHSCLLKIRDGLKFDENKVRRILKGRFQSPDYTASNIDFYAKR